MARLLEGCELAFRVCGAAFCPQKKKTCVSLHMPVYGDVFQEFVGRAVVQDDTLGRNLEGNLLRLLPAGFSLLHKQNRRLIACKCVELWDHSQN